MFTGFKVGCITKEQEKIIQEVEDTIKAIEDQGKELKDRKDKQIESIDKEQEEWIKIHQRLDKNTSMTKARYYEEKCYAQDKEIDLLWKKVRAYEYYGDIEKHLKNVAIQELIKVKNKLRETFEAGNQTEEGDIKPSPNREWRKVWKEKEVQRSAGSTSSNKEWRTYWK
jgi:Mg2+ and Co2+ transporter CorA